MQVILSCRFSFDPSTKLGLDVASCLITRYLLQLQGVVSFLGEALIAVNARCHVFTGRIFLCRI
jgi:hypothetical protein